MKKLLSIATSLIFAVAVYGQTPVITFDKTTHDFGKINEVDGRVTTVFEFKNEGMTPLVLSNVRASCGCTTPKWTHEPIEPGKKGEITVTYNPAGRPGRFQKTVTVTSNASTATMKLYIKGEVIPKPAKPVDAYPVKMGNLSLKRNSLYFGNVQKGSNKMLEIEYSNQTDQPVTVDVVVGDQDTYFKPNVTLKEVGAKQTGKIQVTLKSEECPLYGPINGMVYVIVNGNRNFTNTYAIKVNANIREDFSKLTVEERQQAPIVKVEREINLGSIKAGKKGTYKISLSNVGGGNPLHVRRIVMNDPMLKLIAPKSAIKSGKKGDIKVELNTVLEDGNAETANYSRIATLITNDPNSPVINLKINWVVE